MLRRVAKDTLVYGAGTLISGGVGFFLIPIYTHLLEPRDYGAIELLTVLGAFFQVVVALEISQGFSRYFADSSTASQRERLVGTALSFTLAAYTVVVVVLLLVARPLAAAMLGSAGFAGAVAIAGAAFWMYAVFAFLQNQLRWELRPVAYSVASISFTLGSLVGSIVFVVGLGLGVRGVFLGQVLGGVCGSVVSAMLVEVRFRATFDPALWREMVRFSLPLVPSSVAVVVAQYVDRIAIRELLNVADVGIYAIAFRVASVAGLVMVGFQSALTPLLVTRHSEAGTPRELARIFRWFIAVASVAVLGLTAFAPQIVGLIATPAYRGAARTLPFLVPATFLSAMYVFAPGPMIARRTAPYALVNGAAALLNVVLNLALVPLLGIRGSALATLASSGLGFVALLVFSHRLYPVPHEWGKLATASLVLVACLVLFATVGGAGAGSPAAFALRAALVVLGGLVVFAAVFGADRLATGLRILRPRTPRPE